MSAAIYAACRCSELGDECPACRARIAAREDGDDFTPEEWDRLEAGALWNYPPTP